jgi:ferritin-like metal-binding protein YciE
VADDINDQLVKHLTDVHSIEEQALVQMRRAPDLAGTPRLAEACAEHLEETERQRQKVHARLAARHAEPSSLKDLVAQGLGFGMVLFARVNSDTTGKLVNHAYSDEHMELAAYELLARVAERAGDTATVEIAREIAAEEEAMAIRLEACFDEAVAASLQEHDRDDVDAQLNSYLADAHAIEKQALSLLEGGRRIVENTAVAVLFDAHLDETRSQESRVEQRLEARGSSSSTIKDVGMRLGGFGAGGFFAVQPDTPAKLTGFAFAFEHLEIAAYEQLSRVARHAGDDETAQMAVAIADEERAMGRRIAEHWDDVVESSLRAQGVAL